MTDLTHKLTSFKTIEMDMGLCQNLDTIPASLGPALPIATLQWKIIIYKTG